MFMLVKKMSHGAPSGRAVSLLNYEDAVRTLNNLQSNAAYINAVKRHVPTVNSNLQDMKKYLIRSGLTVEQMDSLSVIHVAGTKGKGSTCAFVEAILREHGFRTGFFSSPHLISVRERFRIDGRAINEIEFSRHFWRVYNSLKQRRDSEADMPQYFKFLTVLMFHIFLKANIDVAIVEVGIGGEYDSTNIVNSTVCAGITSLGLDHTALLGNTLEDIAFQKSGIFKPGVPAFTADQPNDAMSVLRKRAIEKNCPLAVAPNLESYPWKKGVPTLGIGPLTAGVTKSNECLIGIRSSVQNENASLAIQLASAWIARRGSNSKTGRRPSALESTENFINDGKYIVAPAEDELSKKTSLCFVKVAEALVSCVWPGRTQILRGKSIDFYIDGAHTAESIGCCVAWFRDAIKSKQKTNKYLIFNATGDRDAISLLTPLKQLGFRKAYFTPNTTGLVQTIDQENFNMPLNKQMEKCLKHVEMWGENSVLANNVYEALTLIKKDHKTNCPSEQDSKPQVLVTGSLHLVGALMSIVDPHLRMSTTF